MAAYAYTLVSLNGVAINSGNLRSWFSVANGPGATREVAPIEANVVGKGAVDVRGQPKAATWEINVQLLSLNQTELSAFYSTFSEEAGLVLLRATDGDGATWRVSVRVLRVIARTPSTFVAVVRVPDPIWQADSLTTDTKAATSGDSVAITLTNNGNRKCRPTFAISPGSAKTNIIDDYGYQLRGFVVNRALDDFINLPVWLFDSAGAAGRLATDSSASGVTVKQTSGATTTAEVLDSTETDIDVTSAAGFSASGGMYYITDGANDEQGYYTGISGSTLTGCVRGIGGTVAAGHASGVAICPSAILKNGDDTRVWIDDVEYPRWLVGWNSAASDVVVNLTMPRKIALTLTAALTSGATSMKFVEGAGRLAPSGFLACESEVFYYAHNDGDGVSGVVRGVWGTTAASHTTAQAVLANPRQFVIATGKATATAAPSPPGERPAVQLNGSGNLTWKWGDQADDASTIFYDPANPQRSAQWTPGLDLDGNDIVPLTQLSASGTILTFKDDTPGDGSPAYNYAEIAIPQGVRNGTAAAFSADWTPAAEVLNLELHMRDASGTYKLIDQLQQAAAAAARALPASLTTKAYGVKLKARYNVVTGHRAPDSNGGQQIPEGGSTVVAQPFKLEKKTRIKGFLVRLRAENASSTMVFSAILFKASGNLPQNVNASDRLHQWAGTVTVVGDWAYAWFPFTIPLTLDAGNYAFGILESNFPAGVDGEWAAATDESRWEDGSGLNYSTAVNSSTGTPFNFGSVIWRPYLLVVNDYDAEGIAPINSDQPVRATGSASRTGLTASFDKVVMLISTAEAPYVHRVSAFAQSLYHAADRMVNATTGDEIAIDKWMALNSTLRIDCDARVVEYTDQAVTRPVPRAVTPSNTADWMPLIPGANSLTYYDPNMINTDIVSTKRDAKV